MLRWNFLNFGRIRAKIRQSEAARDEALAQYQSTVLQALRNAEGALSRFRYQRANVEKLARVDASARRAATLMQQREAQGTASLIDYLDTERQRLAAEQELSQGRAALTNDFVSLQKSLGLGWGATAVATPGGA